MTFTFSKNLSDYLRSNFTQNANNPNNVDGTLPGKDFVTPGNVLQKNVYPTLVLKLLKVPANLAVIRMLDSAVADEINNDSGDIVRWLVENVTAQGVASPIG
jgi:hypothetical protein